MKQADIKIGDKFLVHVGAELCPVIVTRIVLPDSSRRWSTRTRFEVTRIGEFQALPKLRTSAALHKLIPNPTYEWSSYCMRIESS